MDYQQAADYMGAKSAALRASDSEGGRDQGIKQFIDDKTYKPGLGAYKR
ncbi:MAG: p-hydroxycinnamoyl CoA hydratase/lyase, partial [Chloroflexi bacterium]|nr:p-hydroxycinnamoyl CoA hydratase/lyase [Chloroflexota bacterium]